VPFFEEEELSSVVVTKNARQGTMSTVDLHVVSQLMYWHWKLASHKHVCVCCFQYRLFLLFCSSLPKQGEWEIEPYSCACLVSLFATLCLNIWWAFAAEYFDTHNCYREVTLRLVALRVCHGRCSGVLALLGRLIYWLGRLHPDVACFYVLLFCAAGFVGWVR